MSLPSKQKDELQHRRDCILNTIASVPRHFLRLYTSRARQCTLGYESSRSCDSYQLGEMVTFLSSRGLLSLVDFSGRSTTDDVGLDGGGGGIRDYATDNIADILADLRECPSYQIDQHHRNCGLRTRLLPILDHIQAMLASNAVAVSRPAWSRDREAASWRRPEGSGLDERDETKKVYRFTRSMAGDMRLRHEGSLAVDGRARALFTADAWDWTAEDRDEPREAGMGRWNTPTLGRHV